MAGHHHGVQVMLAEFPTAPGSWASLPSPVVPPSRHSPIAVPPKSPGGVTRRTDVFLQGVEPPEPRLVIYRAAAALSCNNREWATAGLRDQLRVMAIAAGATPDWSTLAVNGPIEIPGVHGRIWFEWTGTVRVDGGDLPDEPLDLLGPTPRHPEETMPFAAPRHDGAS